MSEKKSRLPFFLGLAAWEAYRFYKGKGIFNKIRFKSQHDALSNYLETHYPDAFYSDIVEADGGWSCVVNDNGRKIVIYMTKTEDGVYLFSEKEE